MKDKKRIQGILKLLEKLWLNYYPDMKFGQLLRNFIFVDESLLETEIVEQDDGMTLKRIKNVLEWVKKKRAKSDKR